MALSSGVRGLISRTSIIDPHPFATAAPLLWSAFLTMLVAGPWLAPGYWFGTDWLGARHFDFPTDTSSSAPLQAVLAMVSWAVGGQATGKLFVFGVLLVAAATAYKALPTGGFVSRTTAATVYLVNPFVYGRLHYGQLLLLAGYAVMPWAALRLRRLLLEPSPKSAVVGAVSFGLVGLLSLHLFIVAAVLAAAMVLTHAIGTKNRLAYLRRLAPGLLITLALTMAASAYWVIPLLMARGREGTAVAAIKSGDLLAYAAVPDQHLGLLPNLLGLYGFWAEATGRFTSMKEFVPLWPAILAVLLLVGVGGSIAALVRRRDQLAPWVTGLLIAAVVALVLEMGISNPFTSSLVMWLDAHFPVYRGMRDAGKWAALLALVYSQLVGLGARAILDRLHQQLHGTSKSEWIVGAATGLLLALPLYYGNGLLFGMHGEIKPSQYPAGWYAVDRVLVSDPHPGRVLFLPWHQYMRYSFIQNQNSVVASPAPTFFSVPILASANPEVPGIAPPTSPDQVAVTGLVQEGSTGRWAQVLAALNVKYILVAKELDWQSYGYLDTQPGLTRVADYGQILLFRNNTVP